MPTKTRKAKTDPRKTSLCLPPDVIEEMRDEAARQERSLSGIAQLAWKLARDRIRTFPGAPLAP